MASGRTANRDAPELLVKEVEFQTTTGRRFERALAVAPDKVDHVVVD